jgi:hypothetical protein
MKRTDLFFMCESYILLTHTTKKSWCNESNEGLCVPIAKGDCLIIIHAGGEMGFIPNALLMWKVGLKQGNS